MYFITDLSRAVLLLRFNYHCYCLFCPFLFLFFFVLFFLFVATILQVFMLSASSLTFQWLFFILIFATSLMTNIEIIKSHKSVSEDSD